MLQRNGWSIFFMAISPLPMSEVSRHLWIDTDLISLSSELSIEPDGSFSLWFIVHDKTTYRTKRFADSKEAIAFASNPFWE